MANPPGKMQSERAEQLGTLVRKLRRKRGETLDGLARQIPMSASNLSRLELGKQGPPDDEVIDRLAAALDADPRELLRAAGRSSGGPSFEEEILERLDKLGRDVQEVKKAVLGNHGAA